MELVKEIVIADPNAELGEMPGTESLETPKQLAARVGLSVGQVRHLIQSRQLEYVMIGSRALFPRERSVDFLRSAR